MGGNYESAMGKFDEAVKFDPSFVDGYIGLGWTHGKMANLQASIENFQNALFEESGNADALAGLAFAYLADDNYEQAIANANQALAIEPGYSFGREDNVTSQSLHMVLAESYYYMGDFDNAQRELGIVCTSEEDCAAELLEELIRRNPES